MNNSSVDSNDQGSARASFNEPLAAQSAVHASPIFAENRPATPSVMEQTLQSRLLVLATLFCVTGALGLPLLWISPAFSRIHKVIWSIIVMAYTCALIGGTWAIVVWAYRQFR